MQKLSARKNQTDTSGLGFECSNYGVLPLAEVNPDFWEVKISSTVQP